MRHSSYDFHQRSRLLFKASLLLVIILLGLANDLGTTYGSNCSSARYSSSLIAFRIIACLQSSVITASAMQEMQVRLENTGTRTIQIDYGGYLFSGELYNSTGSLLRYINFFPTASVRVHLGPGEALNATITWVHEKGGSGGEVLNLNQTGLYYVDAFLDGSAYPENTIPSGNYTISNPRTPIMPYIIVDAQLLPFNDYQALTLGLLGFIAVVLTVLLIIVVRHKEPRPQENKAAGEVAGES